MRACVQAVDVGDGKNSELVQSCANFRVELGGEPERTVAMTSRLATSRAHRGLHPGSHVAAAAAAGDLTVRSAACSGVGVLDCSSGGDPPLLTHNNLVLEYVDHGAFYYRRFFHQHGTHHTHTHTHLTHALCPGLPR